MILDTARLYPVLLVFSIILGVFHFLFVGENVFLGIPLVGFVLVLRNLRDDGRYTKIGVGLAVLDLPLLIWADIIMFFPSVLLLSGLHIMTMVITHLITQQEAFHFERTILSMNSKDRKLARTALASGKYEDFAKVAKYTSWDSV
ncbi:MAG: hypothetical protein ACXAE3_14945 [Candidatus Kariarchaeaceae archaeon]|jgi:hypothetical protein